MAATQRIITGVHGAMVTVADGHQIYVKRGNSLPALKLAENEIERLEGLGVFAEARPSVAVTDATPPEDRGKRRRRSESPPAQLGEMGIDISPVAVVNESVAYRMGDTPASPPTPSVGESEF